MGVLSSGCWTTREFPASGNINWQEFSQRSPSRIQDLASPNCPQAPMLDTSCQTTSKTRTQAHPSADRLPKVIASSQTPQNTPSDKALSIRRTRSSSTHQNTGTSPCHQKAYTGHWTNITHWGQTPEARGKMTLQSAERRPQTQ